MNNLDQTNTLTSTVLLGCIIIILFSYLLFIIIKLINKLINKLIYKYIETFRSDSNSKRNKMITIYKDNDILDPD